VITTECILNDTSREWEYGEWCMSERDMAKDAGKTVPLFISFY
jgi:hypothetical protein